MGGHQEKECGESCKHYKHNYPFRDPCFDWNNEGECPSWQSKRGRKAGSKSKAGTKKPGPIPKPSGEKMCFPVLSIKGKDLEAYGGIETLKADVKLMVETKLK